jgi:drug/metabolite transporter (DMT)-like permease
MTATAVVHPSPVGAHWGVHARLLGMALMWGASWPGGRILAKALPPLTAGALRFTVAGMVLIAWLAVVQARAGRPLWPTLSRRQWGGLCLAALVGVFGYSVCFMFALQRVDASRAALVVTTNPIFTAMLAAWLFHEKLNARMGLGMVLALVGAATVLTHGAPWLLFSGALGMGEVLLLGCVAAWVVYTLIGRAVLKGIDSLTATTVTAVIGAGLLWGSVLTFEGAAVAQHAVQGMTAYQWWVLAFLSVGATVLAYAWYYHGIAALGATGASSYISLVPVAGVLSAVLWLGEPVDAALLVGGLLAVAGLVITQRARV